MFGLQKNVFNVYYSYLVVKYLSLTILNIALITVTKK